VNNSYEVACFKHSQPLRAGDVFTVTVEAGFGPDMGFCGEAYNPETGEDDETDGHSAFVSLSDATVTVSAHLSRDLQEHCCQGASSESSLKALVPRIFHPADPRGGGGGGGGKGGAPPPTFPFTVSLRCDGANVPQARFNGSEDWVDWLRPSEGVRGDGTMRVPLADGPWYPLLLLSEFDIVSQLRVHFAKPVKSAAHQMRAVRTPPADSELGDGGAGAVVVLPGPDPPFPSPPPPPPPPPPRLAECDGPAISMAIDLWEFDDGGEGAAAEHGW
jgi:hypothetical protein